MGWIVIMNKNKPFQTLFQCKSCGSEIDVSQLVEAIKQRLTDKFKFELDKALGELWDSLKPALSVERSSHQLED